VICPPAISDTGHGMSEEIITHIFEPFFTTKKEKGTGLGLSTCYGIIKQAGGHITIYSEVDKGTTFKIYLPRVTEQIDTIKREEEITTLPKGNETILIAEDEPGVQKLTTKILTGLGYKVLLASYGR